MKTIILAAHGSRQKASAAEVATLAKKLDTKVKTNDSNDIHQVVHAFLQFCDPSLETVIQELADCGVDEMVIFPFFISAGSHVQTDIPRAVETARQKHPTVRFHITRHLGILDAVEDLILGEVTG
ncbi:MAG: CbiX/SirB N-terminal domain-containing protein [Desulfotignum balticum]|uniref:CbiX/SirB N-terminal domain-containing protein n=1 Tax=Desulfotignum balticum TaxID=115781 RepID=A0A931G8H5_9BACT|nr:CbiX/SirB N-terminal domain-containing protein [Desulfotignum balticum]